jgi:PIN domain nuclease of toxin-antitoxin system
MAVLLDTQALVWWLFDDDRLSEDARDLIAGQDVVHVSAVSLYEIEYKRRKNQGSGADSLLLRMPKNLPGVLPGLGLNLVDITPRVMWDAARLPMHHRDPWDRVLVAQSRDMMVGLVSADKMLRQYPTLVLW